jgi:hypothetical protein
MLLLQSIQEEPLLRATQAPLYRLREAEQVIGVP